MAGNLSDDDDDGIIVPGGRARRPPRRVLVSESHDLVDSDQEWGFPFGRMQVGGLLFYHPETCRPPQPAPALALPHNHPWSRWICFGRAPLNVRRWVTPFTTPPTPACTPK